jgi:uncharacterized membrane protein
VLAKGLAADEPAATSVMSSPPAQVPGSRLRFIDMARSIAILLMLEGHFIDLTLAEEWRRPGHLLYDIWHYIRGMTAPMFFTVTGLVFAYLLSGSEESSFWHLARVRKGLLRSAELLFWGYMLQINLRNLPELVRGGPDSWFQAFHVLQCIGIGLLVMIVWFGLLRRLNRPTLALAYAATGLCIYLANVWLDNQPGHFPAAAPAWVQNAFKGPYSVFPVTPWLTFTMYGAAIGVWVRWLGRRLTRPYAPIALLAAGVLLRLISWWFDRQLGAGLLTVTGAAPEAWVVDDWFHARVGEVVIVLGLLVAYENHFRPGDSWFLNIGRNTFSIYIGHVILLYGGIFGLGLRNIMTRSLNPWQAVLGALLFMALFAALAQCVAPIQNAWSGLRRRPPPDRPR